jgi:CubicO group peptidase (beta-lactamase class C family)
MSISNKLFLILIATIFSVTNVWARPFNEVVQDAKQQGFAGIISQTKNGKTQIEPVNDDTFDENTQFAIGSISKIFTQIAILQLAEQGKIDLNDPINTYLDINQFPNDWQEWMPKITVRDLIEHRSGLPALPYWSEGTQAIFHHAGKKKSLQQLFHNGENAHITYSLLQKNLRNSDEDGTYYSNIGYNLLALIIESVSGISYDEYLSANIFSPAKMDNSFSGTQANYSFKDLLFLHSAMAKPKIYPINFNSKQANSETYLVTINPKTQKNERDFNFVFAYGAGSIISSVSDLNKWLAAVFKSDKLLTTQKYKQYLIQLDIEDNIWGHQGELPGYQSIVLYDLEKKRSVVILSNLNYDMFSLYHELVELSGKNINDFDLRGGESGVEREFNHALEKCPLLAPANVALDLLEN